MLRTHHYASQPFLSIYEELSVLTTEVNQANLTIQAINIDPGFPFSLSPGDNITRIRALLITDWTHQQSEEYYYVYDLTGKQICLKHTVGPMPSTAATYLGTRVVRGIPNLPVYSQTAADGTITETTFIVEPSRPINSLSEYESANALYVFRQNVTLPTGGAEIGWILDQGSHFTVLIDKTWFSMDPCDADLKSFSPRLLSYLERMVQSLQYY